MEILAIILVIAYYVWKYWPLSWYLLTIYGNIGHYLGNFLLYMEILAVNFVIAYYVRKYWPLSW